VSTGDRVLVAVEGAVVIGFIAVGVSAGGIGLGLWGSVGTLVLDLPVPRSLSQRVELPGRDNAAVVDDRDVLADVLDQVELVTGEEDGGAALRLLAQHPGQRLHGDRVEPCERFVEDEQLRLV
jgi:hypothetical protein